MPNFKVFQDQAQSMKVQIYGSDTNAALKTSTSGSLDVSASAALPITTNNLAIPVSASTALPITTNNLAIPVSASTALPITTNNLAIPVSASTALPITTNNLAIPVSASTALPITTNNLAIPVSASTALPITTNNLAIPVSASTALPITTNNLAIPVSASTALPITTNNLAIPVSASIALPITTNGELLPVSVALATTDVVFDPIANITGGGPGCERQVLGLGQWTYGVVNNSISGRNALAYLQMSPDGNNWLNDGSTHTIAYNGTAALVAGVFLKYARVYYYAQDATNSAVTLNVFFQGNTVE